MRPKLSRKKLSSLITKISKGFTLIEATLVLALLSLAMAVVFYGFTMSMDVLTSEFAEADASFQAQKGMERMSQEMKNAILITAASSRDVTFWYQDYNGNGTIDAGESVRYTWSATNDLLNRTQSVSTIAIAKTIQSFNMTFDSATPANITTINIVLKTIKNGMVTTLDSSVTPRNL